MFIQPREVRLMMIRSTEHLLLENVNLRDSRGHNESSNSLLSIQLVSFDSPRTFANALLFPHDGLSTPVNYVSMLLYLVGCISLVVQKYVYRLAI